MKSTVPAAAAARRRFHLGKLDGHWLFVALLGMAAAVRVSVYLHVTGESPLFWSSLYLTAMRDHLGEYLWHSTHKPPLTFIIHGAIARIAGDAWLIERNLLLVVTYVLDILAAVLLYVTAFRLGVNRHLAAVAVACYSIAYLLLEQFWLGSHYDHYTLFFTAFFAYCLCEVIRDCSRGRIAALSAAAVLLILQSTVNSLVAPLAAAATMVLITRGQGQRWTIAAKRAAQVAAVPLLALVLLVTKNFIVAGVPATSNLAGMATIMVVSRALDNDIDRVRDAVVRTGVPEWYLWCFDNAVTARDPTGQTYHLSELHTRESGICYSWPKFGGTYWPHDFRTLRAKLGELGETALARIVDKDVEDSRDRQYLYAGYSPNASARWIGVYGNVSLKVYRDFARSEPLLYLRTVWELHNAYLWGAGYPLLMRGPDSARYPELEHVRGLLVPAGLVHVMLMIGAYAAMWARGLTLIAAALRRRPGAARRIMPDRTVLLAFVGLSLPTLMLAAIFSSQVGAENHRYFYQTTPYLLLIGLVFLEELRSQLSSARRK